MATTANFPRYSLAIKFQNSDTGSTSTKSRTISGINVAQDPESTTRQSGYSYDDLRLFANLFAQTGLGTLTEVNVQEVRQLTPA